MPKPLSAVLVGCGGISDEWLKAIADMDDLDLVGLVDLREEAAAQKAKTFGLDDALVATDLADALKQTSPDVVFNCTVPSAHTPVAVAALQHGCHVLGEKPMADSMDSARRAIDAAEKAGKVYAVTQNRRYHPQIRRLRRFLETEAIGPITTLNSDFFLGAHMGGWWYHTPHVLLLDMAIHTFDAARMITGADPVSVFCKEWNPAGSWFDRDASAVAIFEMTGGIVYTYRGSWCSEGLVTSWESEWRVIGARGSATWNGKKTIKAQVATDVPGYFATLEDVPIPKADPTDRVGGHAGLIRDFVDCVREGRTPETVATDNIKSLAMVFAAIESAETGRTVAVRW